MTFDVVVVGGGVMGSALAWRLSARGLKTLVCDPGARAGEPRRDAGWAAAGMLCAQAEARFKAELPHHPWFAAHARLELRRHNVPLTADTVAGEIDELLAQYRQLPTNGSVINLRPDARRRAPYQAGI